MNIIEKTKDDFLIAKTFSKIFHINKIAAIRKGGLLRGPLLVIFSFYYAISSKFNYCRNLLSNRHSSG